MDGYHETAKHYLKEVHEYVEFIRSRDRRVFHQLDVYATRFAQARDEGLGFKNPPTCNDWREPPPHNLFQTFIEWLKGAR